MLRTTVQRRCALPYRRDCHHTMDEHLVLISEALRLQSAIRIQRNQLRKHDSSHADDDCDGADNIGKNVDSCM